MIVIAVILGLAWLVAELRSRSIPRLTLGLLCIIAFLVSSFFELQRDAMLEARYRASIRLLGESIDQGDLERARKAVAAYNQGGLDGLPVTRMLDTLVAKK